MVKFRCIIHPSARIFFLRNIKIGRGSVIGKCDIIAQGPITIGQECFIHDYAILNSKTGYITLNNNVSLNHFSIIFGNGGVEIGHNTAIGMNVSIIKNHDIPKRKEDGYPALPGGKTVVGHTVWIGANVVITDGVTIGDYTVIGANSFVGKDLPGSVVAAGNPARIIRER